ncbi:uncharacterized protein V6R79_000785 [Siganus canaliculatus]
MVELCKQLFETGLTEHEQRQAEVSSFFSGQKAVTDFQQRTSQILAKFEEQHKERLLELQQLSAVDLVEVKISHCNDEINHLCESLFSLEFQLVSQMELFIDKNAVMNALAAGHDNHMQKINNRETQLVQRVKAWKASLIKGIQDKELQQNCVHLSDIHVYANYLRKQLEDKKKEKAML